MEIKELGKKVAIPLTSAIVGGAVVIAAMKFSPAMKSNLHGDKEHGQSNEQIYEDIFKKQEGIRQQFDSLFDEGFIAQNDPFEEMRKMRQQMEKQMKHFGGKNRSLSNPFDSWFSDKFGDGTINDISKREDEGFVYYDIKVDDVNSTSINTKVEKGYITITGTSEKNSGSDGKNNGVSAQSIFKSSFNRTFPLPENVDQNKMQMLTEKDRVILKFPKTRA
jgi:HSP20 family molecular chaperone IbpA